MLAVIVITLILSALEDIRYLSVPLPYLYLAFALSGVYGLWHGYYLQVLGVIVALLWAYRRLPVFVLLPLILVPPIWPLVILGAGRREGMLGEGDLMATAALSLLSPWAGWGSVVGLVLFWGVLKKRQALWMPAIPGILMGALPFLVRW